MRILDIFTLKTPKLSALNLIGEKFKSWVTLFWKLIIVQEPLFFKPLKVDFDSLTQEKGHT